MSALRKLLFAIALIAQAGATFAAQVYWDPQGGTLGVGQTTTLDLVFEDCEPSAAVTPPSVPDVSFGRPSQSSQTSIINFKMSRRTVFSYPVLPIRKGRITIPSFTIETDEGKQTVKSATYDVGEATVGRSNLSIESIAGSELTTDTQSVWAGQVFSLKYDLLIVRRFNPTSVGDLEWVAPTGLVTEPWEKPQNISAVVDGEPRVGFEYRTRAYARDGGSLTIPAANQLINLETGTSAFGLFQRPNVEQYLISSSKPTLTVKPLPSPAPADFKGAVGDFRLDSNVVPQAAAVGEPVTWTLKLEGTGNWPENLSLPQREVSKDFQVIRPQVSRTTKDGTLFEGSVTEDVVLVPTKPGSYTLGPVSYSYFDPKEARYKTISTNSVTVIVRPAVAAATPAAGQGAFSFAPDAPVDKTPAPKEPGRLPLDPLPGSATAMMPAAGLPLGWLLAPAIPLFLAWLVLSFFRARRTDALRPQREARLRLGDSVAAVGAAGDAASLAAALRHWQRTVLQVLGARYAAPTPAEFRRAAARYLSSDDAANWVNLWIEAERAIYGKKNTLTDDWTQRAIGAAGSLRLPAFRPFTALRLSNLFPIVIIALMFAAPRAAHAADDASTAYNAGDFAKAETQWRKSVASNPLDWKAQNNLGLALAQQEKWSEAAAHWAAAFAQHPNSPDTRFQFELGVARAEFTSPQLSAFAEGHGIARLARLASPATWQFLLVVASGLAAVAGVVYLWDRYAGGRWWRMMIVFILLFGSIGTAATATGALHTWGLIAHPDVALIWKPTELRSVPTEAGEQQTEPLGAGTIARVEKSFLGWTKLSFPEGQTGWVRSDTVVQFYR